MLDLIRDEIASPYYQQNFANDGQRFVAWYLRRVLLRDDAATRDDITDGPDDKQIDAVIVDDAEARILIIQGKFIGAGQVDGEPLREVLSAWLRLQDLGALQRDCNERLKKKLEAVRQGLEDEYRLEFELVTTGALTEAAQGDLRAFSDQLKEFDDFSADLQLVDTATLELRLAEAEAQELPSLEHVVALEASKSLVATLGGTRTVLAMLPLTECLKLPGITDGRLFRKNVRQSLGQNNKVNRALRATIHGERVRDFFFYHNGVTALCNSFSLNEDGSKLTLRGLSIVNGCQSLTTIYSASERVRSHEAKDAYVLFRFYETPDRSFADRISINTNSQSAVKARDLRSNDKVMVGLKRAYETRFPDGLLMTKRGDERPADKDATKTVDVAILARMLMAWHCQRPNVSYNEKKLFDEHYKTIFRTGYDPESIAQLNLWLIAIDAAWSNLGLNDALKAGRSYVKYHLLFAVSALIAEANKRPTLVVHPKATANAYAGATSILPMAATCLEKAMQNAINQAQGAGRVFSPQNWLKNKASVEGATLVAGTIASMLDSLGNGAELIERMRVPESAFAPRWSAE